MNGLELANHIRDIDSNVAIILMSAFDMKELGISSRLRIAELLQKPVTADRLRELISKYVPALPSR
jgi:two-component SAPR family response regulator